MKLTKDDKAMLRAEALKTWRNESDADWFVSQVSGYVELGGGLVVYMKPHVKTHFCFGEHTYDYDEVMDYCEEKRNDVSYFIAENLEGTEAKWDLDRLKGEGRCYRKYRPVLVKDTEYGSRLARVEFADDWSMTLKDGQRDLTQEEKDAYGAFLEEEQAKFEKRLNTYLKRYGLSKCQYWTYWADR